MVYNLYVSILGREDIFVHDDFNSIGGDSITNIRILATLRQEGYDVTVKELYAAGTIAYLAQIIDAKHRTFAIENGSIGEGPAAALWCGFSRPCRDMGARALCGSCTMEKALSVQSVRPILELICHTLMIHRWILGATRTGCLRYRQPCDKRSYSHRWLRFVGKHRRPISPLIPATESVYFNWAARVRVGTLHSRWQRSALPRDYPSTE
ncbi:hypothetical protein DFH09DRAFT_20566 [Mycena vulgaris]|nr:hypothetical protein DFH09DRAFT_20566 [Mycena vulgaris]